MKNSILAFAIMFISTCLAQDTIYTGDSKKIPLKLRRSGTYFFTGTVKDSLSDTSKNLSKVVTGIYKSNGSGTIESPANTSGTWKYYENRRGFRKRSLIVLTDTFQASGVSGLISTGNFILSVKSTTSAGVYQNGILLRTLWSNQIKNAGTYTITWDGKNNAGQTVTGATQIKVISHNMKYTWNASIGNSSRVSSGPNKVRALRTPTDAVVVGDYIYVCTGFVEGNSPTFKLALNDINYMIPVRGHPNGDIDAEISHCASDGKVVYWAGYDSYGYNSEFGEDQSFIDAVIYGTKVIDDKDYLFSSGQIAKMSGQDNSYQKAIGIVKNNKASRITGLAVGATYLYSTHLGNKQVKCYNKTTGALVRTISLPLGEICIEGNLLFGINGSSVKVYTINSTGTLTYKNISIAVTSPLNVSVQSSILYIIDASTQQVKAYNTSGSSLWTYGQSGGYKNSPLVTNDKFQFVDYLFLHKKGFICPQTDGSFWIGDAGNCRTVHISSSRTHIKTLSYFPMNYNCGADINNPLRVTGGFLEFDASSGQLVANWSGNLSSEYLHTDRKQIFYNLVTLQGKTFGTIQYYPNAPSDEGRSQEVVELTSTGLRFTGIRFEPYASDIIERNGDIVIYSYNEMTSGTANIYKKKFKGITNGNPVWDNEVVLTTVPLNSKYPTMYSNSRPSSKGYFFSPLWQNSGYHLGRVVNGKWAWMTSKSTSRTYSGEFPSSDSFDCGNGVEYAGSNLYETDSFVCWNYVGEFWKNNQTNVWKLFHQDGLMLMHIGKTGPQSEAFSGTLDAPAESSGNAYAGRMVNRGGNLYIYYNDEGRQSAIGSFKIEGLNTIKIHTFKM